MPPIDILSRGHCPFLSGFDLADVALPDIRSGSPCPPAGSACRCCCCTAIRRPTPPGTRWRRGSGRRPSGGRPDLRGYGDSDRPDSTADHAPYAKRVMAADAVALMRACGYERFAVVGHDRGGRVAHRMALDHAAAVDRLAVLDIAPTQTMYARTDRAFATRYFWWFFLIQPAPLPERMIGADPEAYLRHHLAGQSRTPGFERGR